MSVVVCTHRFDHNLPTLISALQAQTYKSFEVVLVNDGPDAEVQQYLGTISLDRLRVVPYDSTQKSIPGKKAPLTAGIQSATHSWILVTDVDCTPGRDWIATMMQARRPDDEMVLGVAPFMARPGLLNLVQRFDAFMIAIQYLGAALRGAAYMGVGRNMLYRKSLFDRVGGFSGHAGIMSGDDDLLVQSAGSNTRVSVSVDPRGFVYSEPPSSLVSWIWQKRRHISTGHAYSNASKFQTTAFALSWLIFWSGLPILLLFGIPWMILTTAAVMLWVLFGLHATRFAHRALIPWFPLLAPLYCLMILIFAILLILKPPDRWSLS